MAFTIALAATAAGALAPAAIALDFMRLAGGGIVLGLAVGLVISLVTTIGPVARIVLREPT